jgi:hypothetical protein
MTAILVVTRANGEVLTMPLDLDKSPDQWSPDDVTDVVNLMWSAIGLPDNVLVEVKTEETGFTVVMAADDVTIQLGPVPISEDALQAGLDAMGRRLPDMLSD